MAGVTNARRRAGDKQTRQAGDNERVLLQEQLRREGSGWETLLGGLREQGAGLRRCGEVMAGCAGHEKGGMRAGSLP